MGEEGSEVTEAELSGLEERAEDLYENAPCGYLSMQPDGTLVRINNTLLQWLGYTRGELLHRKRFQDLLSMGGKIYFETHFGPLLQMQGFVNELSLEIQTHDRKLLPVLINLVQLRSEDGKPLLLRAMLFNITDRKKYERELVLARRKAEAAAKAKADFLSTVSHEIRTPLNAIIGISNLLSDTAPTARQSELINVLRFSADNLLQLINDILDFSKIEAGKVELQEKPVNLRELCYSTLYSLSVKAESKDLALRAELDERLPAYVLADQVKLTQVLTNLLGNAIKFTEAGSVTLRAEVQEQTAESVTLRLAVEDTGIGIPADRQQQIFEEFTQASYDINVQYGGTGLGLSISRKLLQLYGSELRVESEEGRGSVFYFTLRLNTAQAPAETELAPTATGPAVPKSLAGVRLLLAEDNPVNVFVVGQFLDKWGVQYDVAANGAQALEMVQRQPYHLVLMDLQMPVLDGYQASRTIRDLPDDYYRQLPIIALSASSKFDLAEKLETCRITDFISKPFDPEKLHALISHYATHTLATATEKADAAPAAPAPHGLDLQQFLNLTEGDPEARLTLFRMTIRDVEHCRENLKQALQERNAEELSFVIHKIKMLLKMLNATQTLQAMETARRLATSADVAPAQLEHAATEADRQLQEVADALRQELGE